MAQRHPVRFPSLLRTTAAIALAVSAHGQEAQQPSGILPIPDYSGEPFERSFVAGDVGGERRTLAEWGITFDVQWTQFAQGVVSGGLDTGWELPGSLDTVAHFDLLRMKVWPALVTVRAETRYGDNVNGDTGLLLPANTDVVFPLTDPPDADLLIAITELNVVQPLSGELALVVGKVQTLDADPSEFASGRGRDQFFEFPLIANPVTALTVPYSTLAAGVLWNPGAKVHLSSTLMNSTDSSTTSGFDDVGDGTTWASEADFQHRLGDLPGGVNAGFLYAFDGDFLELGGKLQITPGGLTASRENDSWAAYGTVWQYLDTRAAAPAVIQAGDAAPDVPGYGVFARFGVADRDTNPFAWSASLGLGGRGTLGGRDRDTWGVGYFHSELQEPRTSVLDDLEEHAGGVEGFYGFAIAPSTRLTLDAQWLQSAFSDIDDAIVLGVRLNVVL